MKLIFFADDDADDHLIFNISCRDVSPEMSVKCFYSCEDIINYLKNKNNPLPDAIFLDHNMPGNDGYECLKRIKTIRRLNHIPIVIYTTGYHYTAAQKSMDYGAYKYVIKPATMPEIRSVLSALFAELEQVLASYITR